MRRNSLTPTIVLLCLLTLLSGGLHGWASGRWGMSSDVDRAAEKLVRFPERVGAWTLRESDKLDPVALKVLDCAAYFLRTYRNEQTGEEVRVTVLLGPAGPTAVHTPEICFSSKAHQPMGDAERARLLGRDGVEDELWSLTFESTRLEGGVTRVFYGWSTGAEWSAASNARFAYAGQPYLYKLQLAASIASVYELERSDPCNHFLADFLPELRKYLHKTDGGK